MKYRLYGNGNNDTSHVIKEVLEHRGIKDYKTYLNLDGSAVLSYQLLDHIEDAVQLFMEHFICGHPIGILVDEDPDGFCSSAMLYSYIKRMDKNYPVSYILHTRAKAHGLSNDVTIPDSIKFLIIPDAGTNDTEQCGALSEHGVDILILDHHEMEKKNPYALIVNNQTSEEYTNKELCGAGVVYRFLQALDENNWNDDADDYLDLCALANISDVMDMRSFETRYLTDLGLRNIKNKCLKALLAAQEYSINDKINIHNIQWYITPILNGMIRVGTYEEKELLFQAFIEQDAVFEYKKRGAKGKPAETIQENIYDRAARLCKNAKARQDKQRSKCMTEVCALAEKLPPENKVMLLDVSDILDRGMTGLVAMQVAEQFNKPCILLKKYMNAETNQSVYSGSARNVNHSPIDSLKDVVNSTGVIRAQGHANAFGIVELPAEQMEHAAQVLNNTLKDVVFDPTYLVDFILDVDSVSVPLVLELASFEDIVGQGVEEPRLAVENICLPRGSFQVFGKNEDAISFTINDIKYIQFKCKSGNPLYDFLQDAWNETDSITFHVVGKPAAGAYMGIRTPQIVIEDVHVVETDAEQDPGWPEI